MIENDVIVNKLTTEGIDVSFATGIQFETEEALNTWVGTAKTFMEKPKALNEYTLEELRQGADKGEFKNVQSLLDKVRTESKSKPTTQTLVEPAKGNEEIANIKAMLEEIKNESKATKEAIDKAKTDTYIASKTSDFDKLEVTMLKAMLPTTATEADIDKAVSEYKALMVKRGFKSFSSDSSSSNGLGELDSTYAQAIKDFKLTKK